MSDLISYYKQMQMRLAGLQNRVRISRLTRTVSNHTQPSPDTKPVLIFNASSRLTGLSLNASFSLLTSWSLRLSGVPLIHFVCRRGMNPCMLGTNRADYYTPPPCSSCISQSERFYNGAETHWFEYLEDPELSSALKDISLAELCTFEFPISLASEQENPHIIPLGSIVLPSVRWALRRHNLQDDEPTRYLLRAYILSAYNIAKEFASLLKQTQISAAVIFNGSIFPEATALWVADQLGVRTITHEVGFKVLSTFFTDGQATAYPMQIPEKFTLTDEQNQRLDSYLESRFHGNFTMAGIQFWPEMRGLDKNFMEKAAQFQAIIPVFTNVAYDTSQVHASVVFPDMFSWLDSILEIIKAHPEYLFVIRAHPDEMREGTAKLANESVQDWVISKAVTDLPNIVFISPTEYVSSYELIHQSKFVIVYNSSIGLEAALLGKVVVCGGRARYTQYPIVHFPETREGFRDQVETFIADENVVLPEEYMQNARKFLYFQLYRTSLPLDRYLETIPRQGFVKFRPFSWKILLPDNSISFKVINDGVLHGAPFLFPDPINDQARM